MISIKSIAIVLTLLMNINYSQVDSLTLEEAKSQSDDFRYEELSKKVTTLQTKIKEHHIREDFHRSELSMQTGLFSAIIAILLTIATVINIKFYKSKINELEEKFHEMKNNNYSMKVRIEKTYSNEQFNSASQMLRENNYSVALIFLFWSLKSAVEAIEVNNKLSKSNEELIRVIKVRINYFNEALEGLETLEEQDKIVSINHIRGYKDNINDIWSELFSKNIKEVNDDYLDIAS